MATEQARYLAEVRSLGCILCRLLGHGPTPASLHHPREGVGGARKANDWLQVPLCPEHHTGASGFHALGPGPFRRRYGVDEYDLLALTIAGVWHARRGLAWEPQA